MSTTQATQCHRDWMKVGAEHSDGEHNRARLGAAFAGLVWQEIPVGGSLEMPMMQGEGIKAAIRELRLPKVSHVADSNELAPYGLYGIRAHYKNGRADVYVIDEGSCLVVVAVDFYEN